MDNEFKSTRQIVNEAIAADDRAKHDFDCWQAEQTQRQRIVKKDFGDFDLHTSAPQPQATMDATASEQWNKWASSHVNILRNEVSTVVETFNKNFDEINENTKAFDGHFEAVAQGFDKLRDLRNKQDATIAELLARIDALEERVSALGDNKNGYQG